MIKKIKRILKDEARNRSYKHLLNWNKDVLYEESPEARRMYVLVRSDILPPVNQGIQALHAIIEYSLGKFGTRSNGAWDRISWMKTYYEWAKRDKTVILLGVTEQQMETYQSDVEEAGYPYAYFEEPDLGDIRTAVAVILTREQAKLLSRLPRAR